MPATDGWPVAYTSTWVTHWLALTLNRTAEPQIHHMQITYQGYTAYVAPRHGDSQVFPYDNIDGPRFGALMNGTLDLDLVWYFDLQNIAAVGGWAPNPPCVRPPGPPDLACAPAYTPAGDRKILYFNGATQKCSFDGSYTGSFNGNDGILLEDCTVTAAWRTPALPRLGPLPNDTSAMSGFLDEAGMLQVGRNGEDAAVIVISVGAYSSLNPNDPYSRFYALQTADPTKPLVDCCYQIPVNTTDPDVHYATYDNAAQAGASAEMTWTTNSTCTAQQAFKDGMPCVNKTVPSALLRHTLTWPPPPPGSPPGPPRPPGSHVAFPRRSLKSYVVSLDVEDNTTTLAIAGSYGALLIAVIAILFMTLRTRK